MPKKTWPYLAIVASVLLTTLPSVGQANLVAHWKFDEPGGATAFASVGPVDGTLNGASIFTPAGGILGGAVQLNGTPGTTVSMGNNFMFGSVDFSVQAWIKTTPGNTAPMMPLIKHQGGSFNGYFIAVNDVGDGLGSAADNRAHFYATNGKTGASLTIINNGSWHQLVGVYDVANNQTRLYVDGALEATGPRIPMVANSEPFLIASEGYVDEVRVWDHALTLSEVSTLYEQTTNPVPVPPAIGLLVSGLAGLAGLGFRCKSKQTVYL
jgi:hypothetical protein